MQRCPAQTTASAPVPQAACIGPESVAGLGGLLARLAPRTAMLVTAGQSYERSGARDLIEPALARLALTRCGGVPANPCVADVERGVSLWRGARPDVIVAVGGGSVLDVAKLVGLLGPGAERSAAIAGSGPGPAGVPVIAIPTTAGSGAEATRFATFYEAGDKRSMSHPLLRPRYAFVDPRLTASAPPAVAAAACLDALAHAVESLWAVAATPDSRALAEAALGHILPCLGHVARGPAVDVRGRMSRGAHLAGQAIDLSRTTAAHALSYALTAELGVAHGHAVALVLPHVFRINARPGNRAIRHPGGAACLARIMDRLARLLGCRTGEQAARRLERLPGELGLATRLCTRGTGAVAGSLAAKVNADRLANNPVELSPEDVFGIHARLVASGGAA